MGANYREAYRARSKAEFIAKVGECLKEIEETGYWLELLVDSGIVSEEKRGRKKEKRRMKKQKVEGGTRKVKGRGKKEEGKIG